MDVGGVSYEILAEHACWRIETDGRRLGRFDTRLQAFECALRLACEVVGAGRQAEIVYTSRDGHRHSLALTNCIPEEFTMGRTA